MLHSSMDTLSSCGTTHGLEIIIERSLMSWPMYPGCYNRICRRILKSVNSSLCLLKTRTIASDRSTEIMSLRGTISMTRVFDALSSGRREIVKARASHGEIIKGSKLKTFILLLPANIASMTHTKFAGLPFISFN